MLLVCYVHQKDGSTCDYQVEHVDANVAMANLVTHLMEHISNLAARANRSYRCPIHPNAPVNVLGNYRVITCGWRGREDDNYVYCDKELEESYI